MTDTMRIEILADGTIKTTTDPISPANHQSAEAFLADVKTLTGGAQTRTRKAGALTHTHGGHTHTHESGS